MLHLTVKGKTRFLLSVVKITNKYHWTSRKIITFWQQPSLCNSWATLGFKFPPLPPPQDANWDFTFLFQSLNWQFSHQKFWSINFYSLAKEQNVKLSMFLCQKHIPPCRELSVEHIPCQQSRMLVRWQQASHGFVVCTLCINILCSYWILPCKIPPLCQYSVIVTSKKIIFEEKSKFYVDCNISECKLSLTDAVI